MSRTPSFDRVILDARRAFKRGDNEFIAGFGLIPGMKASDRKARRALGALIAAVEAEGWRAVDQDIVGAEAEVMFHRAR